MRTFGKYLSKLNGHVSNHLCSNTHSVLHKFIVGTSIIIIGAAVSECGNFFVLHLLGTTIHGIGLIPYVSALEKIAEK